MIKILFNKKRGSFTYLFLILLGFIIIHSFSAEAATPIVTLVEPEDLNTTLIENITFICNVSDDWALKNVSLYHNISGNFELNQSIFYGEIDSEEGNVLLMHFNNDSNFAENDSFVYDFSSYGNNATCNICPDFNSTGGKFNGSFEFNGTTDTFFEIADSNSLDLTTNGSIEFWIRLNSLTGNWWLVLQKGGEDDTLTPYAVWVNDSG